MNAVQTIETLIKLGVVVKDAWQRFGLPGSAKWEDFLRSPEYEEIRQQVNVLIDKLTSDLDAALKAIEQKMTDVRGGKPLSELPTENLIQYSELSDLRVVLAARRVKVAADRGFLGWLVDDALPWLLANGRRVLALLT